MENAKYNEIQTKMIGIVTECATELLNNGASDEKMDQFYESAALMLEKAGIDNNQAKAVITMFVDEQSRSI